MQAVSGHFLDLESVLALKDFFSDLGVSNINYEDTAQLCFTDFRFSFLLNNTITSFEYASIILLIGTNLRTELPLLNSRIRKNYLLTNKQLPVFSIGLALDYLSFPVKNLGNSFLNFKSLLQGKNYFLKELLFKDFISCAFLNFKFISVAYPKIFLGSSLLNRIDNLAILASIRQTFFNLNIGTDSSSYLSVVSPFLGRLSASEVGFFPGINTKVLSTHDLMFSYLCGVDNISLNNNSANFLVYQGLFKPNDYLFSKVNLILPTTSFIERNATFLNIEGRLRYTKKVIIPFKFIFSD